MLPTTRERRVRQWSRTVSDCKANLGRSTENPRTSGWCEKSQSQKVRTWPYPEVFEIGADFRL